MNVKLHVNILETEFYFRIKKIVLTSSEKKITSKTAEYLNLAFYICLVY